MKYINADKLIAEIEKRLKNIRDYMSGVGMKYKGPKYFKAQGKESAYDTLLNIINSLQQEQPDFPTTDEEVEKALSTIPKVELPDKYKTPDWLFEKQEQPEVDLEEEIDRFLKSEESTTYENAGPYKVAVKDTKKIARHFYELGFNARKEENK